MNTTNVNQTCPLCGRDKHMKLLYGHLVCRKCYYAFASRRQLAFAVDIILWVFCLGIISFLEGLSEETIRVLVYLLFPIFCLKDGFSGFSPGKKMMGVQVVDEIIGKPVGFDPSFKRNLPLIIPLMPLIVAFELPKGKRIGDGWARTRVIWKKYKDKAPFAIRKDA
ncbi:MAG: RDD family protein [Acidobacteriota bacterium]